MQTKVKKWWNGFKFGYSLQELLSKITSKNIHKAIDAGVKRGKEVW